MLIGKIASFHFIVVVSVKNLLKSWMLTRARCLTATENEQASSYVIGAEMDWMLFVLWQITKLIRLKFWHMRTKTTKRRRRRRWQNNPFQTIVHKSIIVNRKCDCCAIKMENVLLIQFIFSGEKSWNNYRTPFTSLPSIALVYQRKNPENTNSINW